MPPKRKQASDSENQRTRIRKKTGGEDAQDSSPPSSPTSPSSPTAPSSPTLPSSPLPDGPPGPISIADGRVRMLLMYLENAEPTASCDPNLVDDCLNEDGFLWEKLPRAPYIPFHYYRPDREHGVSGWKLAAACGHGDKLFMQDVYKQILLFKGQQRLQNPLFVDPRALVGIKASTSTILHIKYGSLLGDPNFAKAQSDVVRLATVGMIMTSNITAVVSEHRKVKEIQVLVDSAVFPRLQTVINIGFDKWDSPLCASVYSGSLSVSTRPAGFSKSSSKSSPKRRFGGGMPVWSRSPNPLFSAHPAPARGSSLGAEDEVPVYDGRAASFNFESERPFEHLPKLDGELDEGDMVWFGFGSALLSKFVVEFGPVDSIQFNILWIVLLSKPGADGFNAVYQEIPDGQEA